MSNRRFPTRMLVSMAMLTALSVVLARFIIPMPNVTTRYSIEQVPIVIAGILFGPFAGAIVGFVADLVGCLFSGYGWNPLFSVPPLLYGLVPGLFVFWIKREEKPNLLKLLVIMLIPAAIGSVLWQSFWFAKIYGVASGKGFTVYLATRLPQFAVQAPAEAVIIWLLFRTGMFKSLRLWPRVK